MSDEATRHNQAAYDQIAGLYAARQTERERGFRDLKAAFVARLPRVADIADLGCGPADDGALFAQAGHHVIGIDRSAGMLAYAARALSGLVLQADLRRLPVASQSIDGIWCCAALLHVAHDQTMEALREMRRILRPDGCLALVTAAGQEARLEPVPYAPGTQRWFFYREPVQLEEQLRDAGLRVMTLTEETSSRHWLKILACARLGRSGTHRRAVHRAVHRQAGLRFLATADATRLTVAEQASCLRGLEHADTAATAARTSMLTGFNASQGYVDDGDYSLFSWLRHRTQVTHGTAADHTGWVKRAAAHPEIHAALAAEAISKSYAREICRWTGSLPADARAAADEILLAAAASGLELEDLARLAAEMYEKSRQDKPDTDGGEAGPGQAFDDRAVKLATTFGGAGGHPRRPDPRMRRVRADRPGLPVRPGRRR